MEYKLTVVGTKREVLDVLEGKLGTDSVTIDAVHEDGTPAESVPTTQIVVGAVDANIQTDKNGVAYDPELHSSSMRINADGSWKAKRGAKKPPTPPVDSTTTEEPVANPGPPKPPEDVPSDFPALMTILNGDNVPLETQNEYAYECGVNAGIYSVATQPEKWAEVLACHRKVQADAQA